MGRPQTRNNFLERQNKHEDFMNRIHRATVTDVHINKGTISVVIESFPYAREVLMPLVGLSMPPGGPGNAVNDGILSWGRYVPQTGDMVLVGFGTDGTCYSLGYHAVYYKGMDFVDEGKESRGGTGWGEASDRRMKPGYWDFRSSENCTLFLGNTAKVTSGPHSITLNKDTGDITTNTGLIVERYGEASEVRKGDARRFLLPTDSSETYIVSTATPDRTIAQNSAQESTDTVKFGTLAGVPIEVTKVSHGEVVDDLTKTAMIPSTYIPFLAGTQVRSLEAVKDPAGATDLYLRLVDNLGNFGVSALTATAFQWVTPLAAWNISNLSTTIVSTANISLTATTDISLSATTSVNLTAGGSLTELATGAITRTGSAITDTATAGAINSSSTLAYNLTAGATMTLTAPLINLLGLVTAGGTPLIKLTPDIAAAWGAYYVAAAAAWTALSANPVVSPDPATTAIFTTAAAAAAVMGPLLAAASS